MTFNTNLPIKKSKKDINSYIKNGPLFGNTLFKLYKLILESKLKNAEDVQREYVKLMKEEFYKTRMIPINHEVFPFIDQKNTYGNKFNNEICVSVNDCVAHGFYTQDFKPGDVISIDCGFRDTTYNTGKDNIHLHYDSAFTVKLPAPRDKKQGWVDTPRIAIQEIVKQNPKTTLELGAVIEEIADKHKMSIVLSLTGHGIGYSLHEAPIIYNAQGQFLNEELFDGLCFCAEPIFSPGKGEKNSIVKTYIDSDGWSIYTRNGNPTSHFETMLCVDNGQIIDLTGMTEWSL